MLAGGRGPRGNELSRRSLEDNVPAVMTSPWSEVDDPVGVRHDGLVMRDHLGFVFDDEAVLPLSRS